MRKLTLLLGLGVLALLVTGCTSGPVKSSNDGRYVASASWAEGYDTLPSLKAHSDLVVVGTFTKSNQQTQDKNGTPTTEFTFSVSQTLYNPKTIAVLGSVVVYQVGGVVNGEPFEVDSDPRFQVGEQAVLFLHEFAPGNFFVVGGPNGRFEIKNGVVTPAQFNIIQFAPTPLLTFQTQVVSAAG